MRFQMYRYQILPINRAEHQLDMATDVMSIEDLLAKKNEIFFDRLKHMRLDGGRQEMNKAIIASHESTHMFKLNVRRTKKIETFDFKVETLSSWPSIFFFVFNASDQQIILVQEKVTAFQKTKSVADFIVNSLNKSLRDHNLVVKLAGMFKAEEFWTLAEQYHGEIQKIRFELITPNMANISGAFSEDIKAFAKTSNAIKTDLSVEALPGASIDVDKKNLAMQGIVEYASQGGGSIKVKVSKIRRYISTQTENKSIEIDDLNATGNPEDVLHLIEAIVGNQND